MSLRGALTYTTSRGRTFDLGDGEGRRFASADPLRSHEWSHKLGARGVSGVSADAVTVEVELTARAGDVDAMRRAMDADTEAGAPGTMELDGWSQRALLLKSKALSTRGLPAVSLEFALLDGAWRRARTVEFQPAAASSHGGLDLPCDLPFDLAPGQAPTAFEAALDRDADVLLRVFGPAFDPAIVVDGNRYALDAELTEGARIEVDGSSWPRTIRRVGVDGTVTDVFAAGHRAGGAGSGEYIFEPLHPTATGWHEVTWPGTFAFSITWYERDSEPGWGDD